MKTQQIQPLADRASSPISIVSFKTWFGPLSLAATERGICRLALPPTREQQRFQTWCSSRTVKPRIGVPLLAQARQELTEYVDGTRRTWTVPLDVDGSTFFQEVWTVLCRIPYGQTLTYRQLAEDAGRPRAFRAAGAACAANPVPLIIPCHRAVGSNGSLRGFGGGLDMKRALLDMETG